MTCHHAKGDPNCSSTPGYVSPYEYESTPATPDKDKFSIEDVEEIGPYLVVRAKYPNCSRCAYEGDKVMVFEGVSVKDAIKWRTLDPHFGEPSRTNPSKSVAPYPVARFPASTVGWEMALLLCRTLVQKSAPKKVFNAEPGYRDPK